MTQPPTHKNVLGYMEGLIESLRLLNIHYEEEKLTEWVWQSVEAMKSLAIKNYKQLDQTERNRLFEAMNLEQRLYFQTFIQNEAKSDVVSRVLHLMKRDKR